MAAKLELLENGVAIRKRLLATLGAAERSLSIVVYIFAADKAGRDVLDGLVKAARRGVGVRVVIDGFGSSSTPESFFAPLRQAGGVVRRFNTGWHPRYLFRNHQKFVVADGRVALIGGFNVADDYFGDGVNTGWRETGIAVAGDAVAGLQDYFAKLWDALERGKVRLREFAYRPANSRVDSADDEAQGEAVEWVVGSPGFRRNPYDARLRLDLARSSRLAVLVAYFSPPARLRRMIGRIARRGGVDLVLPHHPDIAITRLAAWYTFRRLLRDGCAIHEYLPRPLHAKLIVADDVVYAGSANLDFRSLHLNFEMSLRVRDAALAAEVRELIGRDIARSTQVTQEIFDRSSGRWQRLLRWAAYAFLHYIDYHFTRRFRD